MGKNKKSDQLNLNLCKLKLLAGSVLTFFHPHMFSKWSLSSIFQQTVLFLMLKNVQPLREVLTTYLGDVAISIKSAGGFCCSRVREMKRHNHR